MLTKPIGESSLDQSPSGSHEQQRSRRRLGGWQTGTGELSAEMLPLDGTVDLSTPLRSDDSAAAGTVPFQEATSNNAQTSRMPPAQSRPLMGRMGAIRSESSADTATATMSLDTVTKEIDQPSTTGLQQERPRQRLGSNSHSAATLPISSVTQPMVSPTTPISAAQLNTAPIVVPTENETSQGTGELRASLSPDTVADIERLKGTIQGNPEDSDAHFELAVILHRVGLRKDARDVLTRLIALYQARGQHQQAARIKSMLGTPKTGPIATEDLPPRPAPASVTTGQLQGRTAALRNVTTAIGRAKDDARQKAQPNIHAFPPESMIFTIPLPRQGEQTAEVRELLRQGDIELQEQKYTAATDSCIQIIALAPDYTPVHLRLAEIFTKQRFIRRARAQAEALVRLADASENREDLWMVYRVILHASGGDTASLKRLVELLIEAGRTEQASIYASRLIQILDAEGLEQEALSYSIRLCDLIPGDTRAALENAVLRLKNSDRGGALDRWESAVAQGADPIVAKASIAALTTTINEDDHWRLLAEVIPAVRSRHDQAIIDAYTRTAAMLPDSATLLAGQGLLLTAVDNADGQPLLSQAAGTRNGAPISRASAAIALAWTLADAGRIDEYVAAIRTALTLLKDERVANHPAWEGLLGRVPRFEDLSLELGEALLARGDAAGAVDVLKEGHARSKQHGPICERLAEAYFKIGQLGSALTVLDELAVHFRSAGNLEAMAGVLRQMSQLAPNNIKVKSRLIDAYLQRGFVAEARAELIQRADLEERSGLIKDAVASLQRAADLSWTIGLAEETFSLYGRVIAMAPDDVGNRSSLVNFYLQMGRLSDAAEHQRAVVDIALRNNHRHEAIAALHQVIGLTPDDTTAYYQLADLLASMGEYHQAEKVYRRLVLMNPADPIAQAKATSMASLRESQA
jgi:tetratricopeptide (TPR) repeat protein